MIELSHCLGSYVDYLLWVSVLVHRGIRWAVRRASSFTDRVSAFHRSFAEPILARADKLKKRDAGQICHRSAPSYSFSGISKTSIYLLETGRRAKCRRAPNKREC